MRIRVPICHEPNTFVTSTTLRAAAVPAVTREKLQRFLDLADDQVDRPS